MVLVPSCHAQSESDQNAMEAARRPGFPFWGAKRLAALQNNQLGKVGYVDVGKVDSFSMGYWNVDGFDWRRYSGPGSVREHRERGYPRPGTSVG